MWGASPLKLLSHLRNLMNLPMHYSFKTKRKIYIYHIFLCFLVIVNICCLELILTFYIENHSKISSFKHQKIQNCRPSPSKSISDKKDKGMIRVCPSTGKEGGTPEQSQEWALEAPHTPCTSCKHGSAPSPRLPFSVRKLTAQFSLRF